MSLDKFYCLKYLDYYSYINCYEHILADVPLDLI